MDPIEQARLAVAALITGDAIEAHRRLDAARQHSTACARRNRQVLEIVALIVDGARERADGLALLHVAEFPEDADLLARMTGGLDR
jgi:hypothetical protein